MSIDPLNAFIRKALNKKVIAELRKDSATSTKKTAEKKKATKTTTNNKTKTKKKTTKKSTPIKGKKHKRTKATEIPMKIKEAVWKRDGGKCIFCNKDVDVFYANAHFIPRSAGGLGIEQNIVTACEQCHHEQDNGLNTKEHDQKAKKYLKSKYGAKWKVENLIYQKNKVVRKK